jgi:membrane protein
VAGSIKDHPVVATALRVQERYKEDAADQLAAAIGFFAFLSLVPLLLLAVAVAGFVYSDPEDQARVALALTEVLPGFEETVGAGESDEGVSALISTVVDQRGTVGLIGAVTLLLAGLRVIASAMAATRVVFRGDVVKGVGGWIRKLVSLPALGIVALVAVAGSALAGIEFELVPRVVTVLGGIVISLGLDLVLFLVAYRVLSTTTSMRWKQLFPGAVLAAVGWSLLKIFGATWVSNQIANANALYGALGGVIALLLLFYLAGRLYLYGAELSAVLVERREGPLSVGDAASLAAASEASGGRAQAAVAAETDGPPPIPRRARATPVPDPGPRRSGATATTTTRARLVEADAAHEELTQDRGRHARTAIAMVLAAGALAAGWRFLGPDRD